MASICRSSSVFSASLVLVFILFSVPLTRAATEWASGCRPDVNYTKGSQAEKNIDTVLGNLVNGSFLPADHRVSREGQSPDRIYGIFQCRGDTNSSQCQNCAMAALKALRNGCLSQRRLGGKVWMDLCFLRFENTSFIGVVDPAGYTILNSSVKVRNPENFGSATQSLLQSLSVVAQNSSGRYAAGSNTSVSPAVYGLVQCWNELTVQECSNCLQESSGNLSDSYTQFTGAKSLYANCMAVFDTTKFFFGGGNSISPPAPVPQPPPTGHGPSKRTLAITLGATAGVVLLFLVCCFCWIAAAKSKKGNSAKAPEFGVDSEADFWSTEDQKTRFSMEVLVAATNNFDNNNRLGQGGFGRVYKGTLSDGKCIAVKQLSGQSYQGNNEFINEIKIVANVQHRNLVNLLGCCIVGSTRMLIYEYMPNGSLEKLIFGTENRRRLDWQICYNIIAGVAKGLLYLHQDSKLKIIHRDIKPSNILLDDKFNPKIADFGIAKLFPEDQSRFQTRVAGTYGYMAPEYVMNGQLSIKADVYSFGVVILEILSGKQNSESFTSLNARSLLGWAWRLYQSGTLLDMVDENLIEQGNCVNEQVIRCLHIALLCVQADASMRPAMVEVVMMLSTSSVALPIPTIPAFLEYTRNDSILHSNACSVSAMSPR